MIHPLACVHPQAQIHPSVRVEAFAIIDAEVVVGENCVIGARVHLYSGTHLAQNVRIWDGAVIGAEPPDLKFKSGTQSFVHIEMGAKIREYVTIHRGVNEGSTTLIQKNALLLAYSHVGHDCIVQEGAVLSNGVQLGGHVVVGKYAVIGGNTAVQQFSQIGDYVFVGGTLKVDRHIPPYSKALGNPLKWTGINTLALERAAFDSYKIEEIARYYKRIWKYPEGILAFLQKEIQSLTLKDEEKTILDFIAQHRPLLARNHESE